jgi:hypothetical protein
MRWAALIVLAVGLLGACSDDARSLEPLLNRCAPTVECPRGTSCDRELGICVQDKAELPYDYRVQVTPTLVTDAGQLAVSTAPRATLADGGALLPITVARAVFVRGSVRAADGSKALEAELVFTPREVNSLGGAHSVFTRPGATGHSFDAQLEPDRTYDVVVYPRGADSEKFPPYTFELFMGTVDQSQDFTYPALVSLRGQVHDEDGSAPPPGLRIKTRYRDRLLATSSIGVLDVQGNFEVLLPQRVLDTPAEHELALDLSGVVTPQNVQIAFDLAKRRDDDKWVMPVLPSPVRFTATVGRAQMPSAVNAQLTFMSDFALPAGPNDQRPADWCQLRFPGAAKNTFRCSAYVTVNVGPDLPVAVQLLPGNYKIVIAPSDAASTEQRLATELRTDRYESRPDGMPNALLFELSLAPRFSSTVRGAGNQPMPSVLVSANALGVRADLPEVALYNRSDRQTTLADGTATLSVDVGFYDLVAAPPDVSGYAWVLAFFNRRIAGPQQDPEFTLRPQPPVLLRGSALGPGREPVTQANVDAYALVPDLAGGPDRAVRIAHTTTDREGKFALQMPPRIGSDDDVMSDGGVADAGRAADAGADAQR